MYSTFPTNRSNLIDTMKWFDVTMIRSVFFVPGKAPAFSLQSYTLKWGPVRAGAQLIRVNSDKQHGRGTATLEEKWWQDRVVKNKEYIWDQRSTAKDGVGSGITAPGSGSTSRGIGISITVRRSGIRAVVRHNNKDHKILKCALLEEPANIFQFSCIFAVTFRSGTKLF